MKSLVEIAKELGIHPNPAMTGEEYFGIAKMIGREVGQISTGLDPDDKHEKERHLYPYNLKKVVYNTRKFMARHWEKRGLAHAIATVKKQNRKDIWVHSQRIGTPLDETPFIHHGSLKMEGNYRERFVADIDLTSPKFEQMIKQLDDFITKYPSDFKITNAFAANRSDTMNVYMTQEITPEIARDLYRILKPCLNDTNHDKLDGLEIFEVGQPIKGIKIGPEISSEKQEQIRREEKAFEIVSQDIPTDFRESVFNETKNLTGHTSLGEKTATLQVLDLMYYLIGKEGQNPFCLESYDGKPYRKRIDFEKVSEKEEKKMSNSIWKKIKSVFKSDKKPVYDPAKDFEDQRLWSDVQVRNADGICYGHRININSFTEDEKKSLKDMLEKRHIQYTERQATTTSGNIKPGDWTIRVTDPASVKQLRSMVFCWAEDPYTRPVFKRNAEIAAEEKMIQEKRTSHVSLDEKPKWADKRYWSQLRNSEKKGYVMDLGTSARYHDLGQPEGAPFNAEEIIKELAKKGIQAEKRVSGFSNCLPSYKMTHDSLVILGDVNAEKFEQMYLQGKQISPLCASKGQAGER